MFQRLDAIARHQLQAGHFVHQVRQLAQVASLRAERLLERIGNHQVRPGPRRGAGNICSQRAGAAANPVDSQHRVQRGAQQRRQPDQPHPTNRGAHVALVQQGMPGRKGLDANGEQPEQMRPVVE